MRHVAGEDEFIENLAAAGADDLAATGQQHREDQPDQHRLAAPVLQEQHGRGRRFAGRTAAQVECDVLVPSALGADGVQPDPG